MTGWRSHSKLEEVQVQEDDLLVPVFILRSDTAAVVEPGGPPSLATLLLSLMQPSMGYTGGCFLGCGPSLDHEIDSLRGLGAFLPRTFTWRGERLHCGENVHLVPMWKWHRCCRIWGAEGEGSRVSERKSAGGEGLAEAVSPRGGVGGG